MSLDAIRTCERTRNHQARQAVPVGTACLAWKSQFRLTAERLEDQAAFRLARLVGEVRLEEAGFPGFEAAGGLSYV